MLKHTILSLMMCGLVMATESFDNLNNGGITNGTLAIGTLTAEKGHAAIYGKGRTGTRSLHITGGEGKKATITFETPLTKDTACDFWAERWTRRDPFTFSLVAVTDKGDKVVTTNNKISVGGFNTHIKTKLPAGTKAIRFEVTSDAKGGLLIDDLNVHIGPMVVRSADMVNPGTFPIMKRAAFNPVFAYKVQTSGTEDAKKLGTLTFKVDKPGSVANVTLRTGSPNGLEFFNSTVFGSAKPDANGNVTITCNKPLPGGTTWLWADVTPSDSSLVGSTISFSDMKATIDGKAYGSNTTVTQRIGYLLAVPGETVSNQPDGGDRDCVAFRIPGMIQTADGALIGCFDARYNHEGDLCADIDVAVVRSTDGGQTWTTPTVAMDAGPGADNGCGDPCILQDKTGRIWLQSLVCHWSGGASLWTSKNGFDEQSTGQWEMTYSDDNGKTWTKKFVNPTRQIKKHEWTTILAGPGNGIVLKDGTIVFPAQIWERGARPQCMSTICYSTDGGKNWAYGAGVPHSTSECQVVELEDGSIMINARNEARQGKRIVYTTKDLGKTWQPHSTNLSALQEPTCQASIVKVDTKQYGKLLLFSNPKSGGRNTMTIRTSKDDGNTWNDGYLYDSRQCMGYSCIAMTDDKHVGIIYETCHNNGKNGNRGIGFIRIPLETVVTGKDVPAQPAKIGPSKK
ncbi:MAG: exo-alpha-sialidase [Akkermansia sp.]|nr:exo-alpha-sialidase [Akkermansia sp.]